MYRIVTYDEAMDQVAALPDEALNSYADALGVLRSAPWSGASHHEGNPKGEVRWLPLGPGGAGQVVYLVLEYEQEVHVLLVQWVG